MDCGATVAVNVTGIGAGAAVDDGGTDGGGTDGVAVSAETEEAEKTTAGTGNDPRCRAACLSLKVSPPIPSIAPPNVDGIGLRLSLDTRVTYCFNSTAAFAFPASRYR